MRPEHDQPPYLPAAGGPTDVAPLLIDAGMLEPAPPDGRRP